MYQAELHNKLSQDQENMEDLLTSNVFSFFKYADREVFLRGYLEELGFKVSRDAACGALFKFWPNYDDRTQPDLVILVGELYLLFEAKYFSGFGEQTELIEAQPVREIRQGIPDAKNPKDFWFLAITADYCRPDEKLACIPQELLPYVRWTNWQAVSAFLRSTLNDHKELKDWEVLFANDLIDLLEKKKLRAFDGKSLLKIDRPARSVDRFFFESGKFSGFLKMLDSWKQMTALDSFFHKSS